MLRVFNHYVSARKVALFFAESWVIGLACAGGAVLVSRAFASGQMLTEGKPTTVLMVTLAALFVPAFQLTLYFSDLDDLRIARADRSDSSGLLRAAGMAVVAVGLLAPLLGLTLPLGTLLGGAMGALGGAVLVRANMPAVVGEASRVLVVGHGARARALIQWIEDSGEGAYTVAGVVSPPAVGEPAPALAHEAEQRGADFVVVAADEQSSAQLAETLLRCRFDGRRVYDVAGFCERILRRIPVSYLRAADLAYSDELTVSARRRFFKRCFDLLAASLLVLFAAPVMLLVALAIRLDSRGPVFYRQERVGRGGAVYPLWKFRSMRTDAERDGAVWARTNDDRVTRVGRFLRKTRLDETPQFINVLLGHMSFVGPRPERPVFVDKLKERIPFYGFREGVKPGITGWAQIRYPYGASVDDARNKLEYDLYYVKNGSTFLDLAIIFHTIRHVLTGRGAR